MSQNGGCHGPEWNHGAGYITSWREPVRVGVLFSLTGTIAVVERSLLDATLLAIEQINAAGGINGRPLEPVVEDYGSDPRKAMDKARKLIRKDGCVATVGCYTSASRKAAMQVFAQENSVLLYPTLYEGQESHPNVIYTGAVPNQQLTDFIPWIIQNIGSNFYLLGSDYVYPRETNRIVRALLHIHNGVVVGEEYVPVGHTGFQGIIRRIAAARPHTVFCTLVGDSVLAFYEQYHKFGLTAADIPITSPITCEEEIHAMGSEYAQGHYTSANYFQSVDTPQNKVFIEAFQSRYGKGRVTHFVMEAAYFQMFLLAQALRTAPTYRSEDLLVELIGQEFLAPQGPVKIHANHHTYLTARIGRVNEAGQFDIIWQSKSSIKPEPWFENYVRNHKKLLARMKAFGGVREAALRVVHPHP